jgi:hypothetical protein
MTGSARGPVPCLKLPARRARREHNPAIRASGHAGRRCKDARKDVSFVVAALICVADRVLANDNVQNRQRARALRDNRRLCHVNCIHNAAGPRFQLKVRSYFDAVYWIVVVNAVAMQNTVVCKDDAIGCADVAYTVIQSKIECV